MTRDELERAVDRVLTVVGMSTRLLQAHRRVSDPVAVGVILLLSSAQRDSQQAMALSPYVNPDKVRQLEVTMLGDPIADVIMLLQTAQRHLEIRWYRQERARYFALIRASWLITEARSTMGRYVSTLSDTPLGTLLAEVGL